MKISIVSCSTRAARQSHKVSVALEQMMKNSSRGIDVVMIDLKEMVLPLFSGRFGIDIDETILSKTFFEQFSSSDGIIFVTPEYNGGISAPLKNLIDSLQAKLWVGKTGGCVAVSGGILGGLRAAQALQQQILALSMYPSPKMLLVPEVQKQFDATGKILDSSFEKKLVDFVEQFFLLTELHTKKKNEN